MSYIADVATAPMRVSTCAAFRAKPPLPQTPTRARST
ncbi:hypothetical protein BKA21_001270 [Cellulomonas oligotrophica]|uniref:Uncharacterized protein n=1 Tax=Cellulomonas oligotrophica TaxID=931536 RepID=A0A7Y9FE79_9CELL|nr:hypothetical protein [Cellulomonas oligotrophica]